MAFDTLTEKLQNIFKNLRSKGRLTENDVKAALREVKLALLEADVNFKVVKDFIKNATERAVGQDVLTSLTPAQMVIKIVNEELVKMMGEPATLSLKPKGEISVIMMCGLQGAGKTTMSAKLANKYKSKGMSPLLVACDIYRPAAIKQLEINASKVGVDFFQMGSNISPVDIAKASIEHAKKNGNNIVVLDTAGRLHIDEELMMELKQIKESVDVCSTILVLDSMTGQDAVNVAKVFDEKLSITGVILTKLDGDARGGAALSIRAVTDKPILFIGTGEKMTDLEEFHPDRMVSRILGMGDILTLIEKAQKSFDEEKAADLAKKLKKSEFDFNDFLVQLEQMKKMGGLSDILKLMPGMSTQMKNIDIPDDAFKYVEAIILSMTPKERANPNIINVSRKQRIAKGAGVDISEVNKLIKQFESSKKMMKQMSSLMGGKKGKFGKFGGFPKMPFGF